MKPVPENKKCDDSGEAYYLPYFSVIRKDALTTKIRNVFNASAPSANGVSLNDTIYPGPKLQTSIIQIITGNRQYEAIFGADAPMYFRQFDVKPEDAMIISILFRATPNVSIQEWYLTTVTYGLDCAPWQSLRAKEEIAKRCQNDDVKRLLSKCFYMDDLLGGADNTLKGKELVTEISRELEKYQIPLSKWYASDPELISTIPDTRKLSNYTKETRTVKVLGLMLDTIQHTYGLNIKETKTKKDTK